MQSPMAAKMADSIVDRLNSVLQSGLEENSLAPEEETTRFMMSTARGTTRGGDRCEELSKSTQKNKIIFPAFQDKNSVDQQLGLQEYVFMPKINHFSTQVSHKNRSVTREAGSRCTNRTITFSKHNDSVLQDAGMLELKLMKVQEDLRGRE